MIRPYGQKLYLIENMFEMTLFDSILKERQKKLQKIINCGQLYLCTKTVVKRNAECDMERQAIVPSWKIRRMD